MAKARIGRPTKAPTPGERVGMSLRVTAEIKERLEEAAQQSGRSLSQEAEMRLEQSFMARDLVEQIDALREAIEKETERARAQTREILESLEARHRQKRGKE